MKRSKIDRYRGYLESLMDYMSKQIKIKPYPKITLNTQKQDDDVFGKTGYYDPEEKRIVLFVNGRFFKDVMRSAAHELVHHYQNLEGRLSRGSYEGQEIINDDRLMKLEEEAYLKGNIIFRSWTETMQKQVESEPTEHMRKLIKLNENQIEQLIKLK